MISSPLGHDADQRATSFAKLQCSPEPEEALGEKHDHVLVQRVLQRLPIVSDAVANRTKIQS